MSFFTAMIVAFTGIFCYSMLPVDAAPQMMAGMQPMPYVSPLGLDGTMFAEAEMPPSQMDLPVNDILQKLMQNPCLETQVIGPCMLNNLHMYYNRTSDGCLTIIYEGCIGDMNRVLASTMCNGNCQLPMSDNVPTSSSEEMSGYTTQLPMEPITNSISSTKYYFPNIF